jgi:hypothetical protein
VDLYNEVAETNETNNSITGIGHLVTVTPCPQSTPTPPPSPTGNATVTATATWTATPPPTATPCGITFNDVPPDNPFYAYIRCLACRGILSGYADGTFLPYNFVTRGQTCKIVSNAAGWTDHIPSTQQTFADVPPSHPTWLFIERAYAHGVISGYADGTFHPDALVTRGQLAKIDSLAAGWSDPIPSTQQTFEDIVYAYPFWLFIERVALHGAMVGYGCGGPPNPCTGQPEVCTPPSRPHFRACVPITRAQTAKVVAITFYPNCQTPQQ